MRDGEWLSETAYDYVFELSPSGLGWEFLRRDPAYHQAYRAHRSGEPDAPDASAWGLVVYADPTLSSLEQPVFWRAEIDARTVVLTSAPLSGDVDAFRFQPADWPGELRQYPVPDGVHMLLRCGGVEHRLWAPRPLADGEPFALLVLPDSMAPARAEAALRFWRCLRSPGPREPARRADPSVKRLRLALRAHDGRRTGASYRELAEGLFGADRIEPETWKTSSVRDATIRLVRSGVALSGGDYRRLLGKSTAD